MSEPLASDREGWPIHAGSYVGPPNPRKRAGRGWVVGIEPGVEPLVLRVELEGRGYVELKRPADLVVRRPSELARARATGLHATLEQVAEKAGRARRLSAPRCRCCGLPRASSPEHDPACRWHPGTG